MNVKRRIFVSAAAVGSLAFLLVSCQKEFQTAEPLKPESAAETTGINGATAYTIPAGAQFCEQDRFQTIGTSRLAFTVLFDSSAMYTTKDPANQADINKLYGFSDNRAHHHSFSARFGWRWYQQKLSLHGYIYNDSIREYKELGSIAIGKPAHCAILVKGNQYQFVLNGDTTVMRRTSKTAQAEGYRLFPYFGGDEVAPHRIQILIKDEQ